MLTQQNEMENPHDGAKVLCTFIKIDQNRWLGVTRVLQRGRKVWETTQYW